MNIENAEMVGAGILAMGSLLGAYYIMLKIREFHSERPDPKLTYVTHAQMDKVRAEFMRCISEAVQDLRALRAEIREEVRSMQKHCSRNLVETRELIGHNAQNISALVAQARIANQRISELSLKTYRIAIKIRGEAE